jgi:hypothetical protein
MQNRTLRTEFSRRRRVVQGDVRRPADQGTRDVKHQGAPCTIKRPLFAFRDCLYSCLTISGSHSSPPEASAAVQEKQNISRDCLAGSTATHAAVSATCIPHKGNPHAKHAPFSASMQASWVPITVYSITFRIVAEARSRVLVYIGTCCIDRARHAKRNIGSKLTR